MSILENIGVERLLDAVPVKASEKQVLKIRLVGELTSLLSAHEYSGNWMYEEKLLLQSLTVVSLLGLWARAWMCIDKFLYSFVMYLNTQGSEAPWDSSKSLYPVNDKHQGEHVQIIDTNVFVEIEISLKKVPASIS